MMAFLFTFVSKHTLIKSRCTVRVLEFSTTYLQEVLFHKQGSSEEKLDTQLPFCGSVWGSLFPCSRSPGPGRREGRPCPQADRPGWCTHTCASLPEHGEAGREPGRAQGQRQRPRRLSQGAATPAVAWCLAPGGGCAPSACGWHPAHRPRISTAGLPVGKAGAQGAQSSVREAPCGLTAGRAAAEGPKWCLRAVATVTQTASSPPGSPESRSSHVTPRQLWEDVTPHVDLLGPILATVGHSP